MTENRINKLLSRLSNIEKNLSNPVKREGYKEILKKYSLGNRENSVLSVIEEMKSSQDSKVIKLLSHQAAIEMQDLI